MIQLPLLPLRVFHIEDEPSLLDLFERFLENMAFPVEFSGFERGEPALGAIGSMPPQLFVIDDILPGMPTKEIVEEIRKRYGRSCGVMYWAGMGLFPWFMELLKIGLDGMWHKPCPPTECVPQVENLVTFFFLRQDREILRAADAYVDLLDEGQAATARILRHLHSAEKAALAHEVSDCYIQNDKLVPRVGLTAFLEMCNKSQLQLLHTLGETDSFTRLILNHHLEINRNAAYHPIWGEEIILSPRGESECS